MKSASGSIRLFEKARGHLAGVPDGMGGLSVKGLLASIDRALTALPDLAAAGRTDLDPALVPALAPAPN